MSVLLDPMTTTRGMGSLMRGIPHYRSSQVIFADRVEDIDGATAGSSRAAHAVDDAAGDAPDVAGAEHAGDAADQ